MSNKDLLVTTLFNDACRILKKSNSGSVKDRLRILDISLVNIPDNQFRAFEYKVQKLLALKKAKMPGTKLNRNQTVGSLLKYIQLLEDTIIIYRVQSAP